MDRASSAKRHSTLSTQTTRPGGHRGGAGVAGPPAVCYRAPRGGRVHAPGELTDLLRRAQQGDSEAANAVFAATYPELRRLARARLRGGGRHTLLDTTSLVHESYLRFVANKRLRLEDRVHFMGYAGRVMRSVIVDFARRRSALRRGSG